MFGLPEIAISAAGFTMPSGSSSRATIDTIASLGVRGIALDGTATGMRARELTRSARRDIAAILRRSELEFAGVDLWIPPEHFTTPATAQRAMDATGQALELAGELAPLVGARSRAIVSVVLPSELSDESRQTLSAFAQQHGSVLADHAIQTEATSVHAGIAIGIDPVYYLMDGQSPAKALTRAGAQLASARLCDSSAMGRCVLGASGSKLDLTGYAGAMIVSGQEWVTLDLRGLDDPIRATTQSINSWRDAGTI